MMTKELKKKKRIYPLSGTLEEDVAALTQQDDFLE